MDAKSELGDARSVADGFEAASNPHEQLLAYYDTVTRSVDVAMLTWR